MFASILKRHASRKAQRTIATLTTERDKLRLSFDAQQSAMAIMQHELDMLTAVVERDRLQVASERAAFADATVDKLDLNTNAY